MTRLPLLLLLAAGGVSIVSAAAGPLIGPIAHVGFRVADLERTRAYYTGRLRIPQVYDQKDASGKTTLAVFQVSRDQFLEFSPGSPAGFTHLAFLTDKLEELHKLVETLGLNPPELRTGRDRTRNFSINDPDGHRVEFVQYEPDSMQAQARDRFVPNQMVWGIYYVGLPVADASAERAFFKGKFNFQENQPGMLSPPWQQLQFIKLLPAGEPVHIGMQVGDDSPPRSGHDPDGTPVNMVGVN